MCEQRTAQAADLAEWIVEEISHAKRDWREIERRALELAELAARNASRRREALETARRWPRRQSTKS